MRFLQWLISGGAVVQRARQGSEIDRARDYKSRRPPAVKEQQEREHISMQGLIAQQRKALQDIDDFYEHTVLPILVQAATEPALPELDMFIGDMEGAVEKCESVPLIGDLCIERYGLIDEKLRHMYKIVRELRRRGAEALSTQTIAANERLQGAYYDNYFSEFPVLEPAIQEWTERIDEHRIALIAERKDREDRAVESLHEFFLMEILAPLAAQATAPAATDLAVLEARLQERAAACTSEFGALSLCQQQYKEDLHQLVLLHDIVVRCISIGAESKTF